MYVCICIYVYIMCIYIYIYMYVYIYIYIYYMSSTWRRLQVPRNDPRDCCDEFLRCASRHPQPGLRRIRIAAAVYSHADAAPGGP